MLVTQHTLSYRHVHQNVWVLIMGVAKYISVSHSQQKILYDTLIIILLLLLLLLYYGMYKPSYQIA